MGKKSGINCRFGWRFLSLMLVLILCMGCLAACSNNGYKYEQKLNIVDDNYRNYYEIFVYSFYDSDGDGTGDLNGVTQKLDYIQDMGFNGIWLMPIMPSDTYHKYDVKNYCEIDPKYGTIDDFKNLVGEAHKRGINVVIDMVINHTSSSHKWFIDACSYLRTLDKDKEPEAAECPYVEYYHFSREKVSDTYYRVSGTDWFYEGSFWSPLIEELYNTADFWLDMGVDGFRMDAAMHFEENQPEFNEQVLNGLYEHCREKNPDFYMVSEVWAGFSTVRDYYASRTPSMFNFDAGNNEGKLIKTARGALKAAALAGAMVRYQNEFSQINPDYIDAPFLTNHDMGRVSNALMNDENDIKMAGGLLMMMSGSPFVYYGEEIGMASLGSKDENKRLPMIWSSDASVKGMTAGPADADEGITSAFEAVDKQLKDKNSILNYYKRALRLRNENPEIARGVIELVDSLCDGNQAAITKSYNGSTIGIVYNTSDDDISVNIAGTVLSDMGIRGYLTLNNEKITLKDGILVMPPQSICILK